MHIFLSSNGETLRCGDIVIWAKQRVSIEWQPLSAQNDVALF